ncbi:Hsp70 family protein [Streptomyces sp. F63]|uniref:Hsp70 family protein n=1 Tax=Streptomyces sp. F63 TaxID=2824887 RepID=UPI001B373365|nr:Hsp70 family protein [Streptomyces sp. F63]MBQ0983778.1 Hsp70 family protein [Streptomyces sp. F63]
MDAELHRVVGIDLGTTYSAVAAYDPAEFAPVILADPELEGTAAVATPSVIRMDPATGALVVGHEAKNAISGPAGAADALVEIKREMGAVFVPELLQRFGAAGVYSVDDPVRARLGDEWLRPQEISALVLMRMKQIAEQTLGSDIHDAVVTVPAYFVERQKKATEEAALLAGLYPRQLIPEPTAAAIAYGVDRAEPEKQVYLVFDLGGGTFDVSIIETRNTEIEVIATAGDQRLGGGDFDDAVARWIVEQLGEEVAKDIDRLRIKATAETAKRELSLRSATTIDLGGRATPLELDRAGFERLIQPILDRSLHEVDEALEFARTAKGVRREDINAVLLVGGSTRIPRVKQILLDYFDQDENFVRADANPDTLVARGAAIVANRFEPTDAFDLASRPNAERSADEQDYTVTLITEHTLGVGVQQRRFNPLISRGTKIPTRQTKTYTNPDMADHIEAAIYQGEGEYVYDNSLIGTIHLDDIEPRAEGHHQFEVEFSLDVNGLLGVQVTHANTGREYQATFDQSTTIGKIDELAERRAALLELYTTVRPVGAAVSAPAASSRPGVTPAGGTPDFAVPPPVTAATPNASAPESHPGPVLRPSPAPPSVPAPASSPFTGVDPSGVPAEYRRMTRKALRAAQDGAAPAALTEALGAFLDAVRGGAAEDALDELADRLEEAYDDSRR